MCYSPFKHLTKADTELTFKYLIVLSLFKTSPTLTPWINHNSLNVGQTVLALIWSTHHCNDCSHYLSCQMYSCRIMAGSCAYSASLPLSNLKVTGLLRKKAIQLKFRAAGYISEGNLLYLRLKSSFPLFGYCWSPEKKSPCFLDLLLSSSTVEYWCGCVKFA